MRTSLFITLSFLLFSTKFLLAHSTCHEPVLDINGKEVESDFNYYAVTYNPEVSFSLFPGAVNPCPFDVIVQPTMERGTIINLFHVDGSIIVKESTDLTVKFLYQNTYCGEAKNPIWKVSNDGASDIEERYIVASGAFAEGDRFQIRRVNGTEGTAVYTFVHCPLASIGCQNDCYSLGATFVDGAYRLRLVPNKQLALRFSLLRAPDYYRRVISH